MPRYSNLLVVILLGCVGTFHCVSGSIGAESRVVPGVKPKFFDLSAADKQLLAAQRAVVLQEAKDRYGTVRFARRASDLKLLQTLIDDRAFRPNETYKLQSLGVVFGDVFTARPDYAWMIVLDEYGRHLTVRFKDTTARINVTTLISKRIEKGETVDVREIFDWAIKFFAEKESEFDR